VSTSAGRSIIRPRNNVAASSSRHVQSLTPKSTIATAVASLELSEGIGYLRCKYHQRTLSRRFRARSGAISPPVGTITYTPRVRVPTQFDVVVYRACDNSPAPRKALPDRPQDAARFFDSNGAAPTLCSCAPLVDAPKIRSKSKRSPPNRDTTETTHDHCLSSNPVLAAAGHLSHQRSVRVGSN